MLENSSSIASATVDLADDQPRRVVILNRSQSLIVTNECAAGSVGQVNSERFIRFDQQVSIDVHADRLACISRIERDRAAGRLIVRSGSGGLLRGGKINGDGMAGCRREGDIERGQRGSGIALCDSDITN